MPTYNLHRLDPDTGKETPQYTFSKSRAPIQAFGGAFANGKTTALVVKALRLCVDYPGSNGLLARATYPMLNDTLRKTFMLWCPAHWVKRRPTQDDNTCYLHNGTVVNFRYLSQRGKQQADGQTTSNLISATYDWIGIDQLEDSGIQHKDFLDMIGRLRGTTPYRPKGEDDPTMPSSGPRWLMVTMNPTGNWVYSELIKPLLDYKIRGIRSDKLLYDPAVARPIIEIHEGSTYTNRHNLTPDFIRNLETTYQGQMRERYLKGEWAAFEGLVYGGFDRVTHMITREQALAHLHDCRQRNVNVKAREAYDFGLVSPTCYGFAFVDDYGRVILLDGFYKPDFPYTEHPKAIKDIRERYSVWVRPTERIIADPDIFKKKVVSGRVAAGTSVATLLQELGISTRPGSNDIVSGVAKVTSYLAQHEHIPHLFKPDSPGPLLYVVDDLHWFSDEIFSYYWKRSPQGRFVDEPVDENDHAMDMIKYMLAKLPDPSEIVTPKDRIIPPWMFWQETDLKNVRQH